MGIRTDFRIIKVIFCLLKHTFSNYRNFIPLDVADKPYIDRTGIRALKLTIDGKLMASGDRMGNIRFGNTSYHFFLN